MENVGFSRRKMIAALRCGLLGCVCFGGGDWLMIYGDTTCVGTLSWLTSGTARIAPWRNNLAMLLAFPGIIFYGIALFALAVFLKEEKQRKTYRCLTAFGLTPWLCLHLFYIMILYGFAWMTGNGWEEAALPVSEALAAHLFWLVIVSEALMLPPYLYWFWTVARGSSVFPKGMALSNPLVFYVLLKLMTLLMPDGAFRLAFTNGLMSESMAIWFGTMLWWSKWQNQRFHGSPAGTIEQADQILAVENDRIAQQGTHKELIQEQDSYQKFIRIPQQTESWRIGQ